MSGRWRSEAPRSRSTGEIPEDQDRPPMQGSPVIEACAKGTKHIINQPPVWSLRLFGCHSHFFAYARAFFIISDRETAVLGRNFRARMQVLNSPFMWSGPFSPTP